MALGNNYIKMVYELDKYVCLNIFINLEEKMKKILFIGILIYLIDQLIHVAQISSKGVSLMTR